MSEASESKLVQVGQTGRAHGIDGEIRLFTEDPHSDIFGEGKRLFVESRTGVDEYVISSWRVTDDFVILGLESVEDRTAAERLTNLDVYVEESAFPELEDGEYYEYELEGRDVVAATGRGDEEVEAIGTVAGIFATGANDVLVVERGEGEELFVPMVEDVVRAIDDEQGRVVVESLDEWAPEGDDS